MNRTLFALALTTISSFTVSQFAYANRPAMEEISATDTTTEETANISHTVSNTETETVSRQQHGDVLQLPVKEIQPGETIPIKLLDFPRRGATMDKVTNELGKPAQIIGSVGQPPITRWIYNDRVVYFENTIVLHVVAR